MAALEQILTFLRTNLGLTPAQAAGVAGNLQVESGFNPAAYNAGEGAIGIAQWEGGRRTALQNYARSIGSTETDLGTQLAFLAQELRGSESRAFQQLQSTSDPAAAAAAFDQYYERSAGTSRDTRVTYAQNIFNGAGSSWNAALDTIGSLPLFNFGRGGSSSSSSSSSGRTQSIAADIGGLWAGDAFTIGLKIMGAGMAAALVVVGALHTVK